MHEFQFTYPSTLIFGVGKRRAFAAQLQAAGVKRVLLHYGGSSIRRSGLLELIQGELDAAGISCCELGGVQPNPRLSMVRQGVALCRREGVDFILACGGGSVIDSAKAIASGVCTEADIWDVMTKGLPITSALPVGVILTLPATASETGAAFVLTNEETKQKIIYGAPAATPRFAIIDPELYLTIPPKAYWPGICDMMSHVMERYFSVEPHTELTDGICEAVMRNIIRNADRLLHGENTLEVWSELALSANMAHNNVCGWGRVSGWSCHMIEHELSAFYDVAHGAGLTVLTPAWMKYIYRRHIPLFAQFAVQIMGVEPLTRSLEEVAALGIRRLEDLFRSYGMPTRLSELGITDDSLFERMAKQAVGFEQDPDGTLGALEPLTWTEIVSIFHLAA